MYLIQEDGKTIAKAGKADHAFIIAQALANYTRRLYEIVKPPARQGYGSETTYFQPKEA